MDDYGAREEKYVTSEKRCDDTKICWLHEIVPDSPNNPESPRD